MNIVNLEGEEWRPVVGYEGLYEVSNLGRVKSRDRRVRSKGNLTQMKKGVLMTPYLNNKYMKVLLRGGNRKKLVYLHRLIAGAFIDNPNNHPMINHIDGNRLNNSIDNLEWCTNSENQRHAISIGLVDRGDLYKRLNNNGRRGLGTAKYVVNLENGVFYESAREAGIAHGVRHGTMASWLNGSRPNKTNLRYA